MDVITKNRKEHESRYLENSSDRGLPIQMFSGVPFYPQDPREDEIDIDDIAHHLSMIVRYNGGATEFYSVAQHSVLLSYLVKEENSFCALMHDATEAYLGDLVRPIKYLFPEFIRMEENIWKLISKKYGLPEKIPADVKNHDVKICFTEKRDLLNKPTYQFYGREMEPHDIRIEPWSWQVAKEKFTQRFRELYEG